MNCRALRAIALVMMMTLGAGLSAQTNGDIQDGDTALASSLVAKGKNAESLQLPDLAER